MTLSCSRHQYAEIVFDQTIDTWLRLHRAAFDFFGAGDRRRGRRFADSDEEHREPASAATVGSVV